ncbi:CG11762, partial [Drosophila busckii]
MDAKRCRVCGGSNICERSLNLFEAGNRKLVRHIQMLTGLRVIQRLRLSQDAPVLICFCCQSDLKMAMTFRRLCLRAQRTWLPYVEEKDDSSQSEADTASASPNASPKLREPRSCTVVNTYRESDTEEEKPQQTVEVMIKEEFNATSIEDARERDHLDPDFVMKAELVVDMDSTSCASLESMPHDDDYKPANQTLKTDKKKLKIRKEVTVYICEQCGAHVKTKQLFERHMRKHTGDRPFACDACPGRFLSASELRAHTVTHTGQRPFPCRYCSNRYTNYTGRLKHERMHANVRPFVCEECGKAFTNNYILKNHRLVHTGERSFSCELCKRSFLRKTHLKTHYRSNTHKQNVEKQQI